MENGSFLDGLPINSMVIFHGYVSHNQRVYVYTVNPIQGFKFHHLDLGMCIYIYMYVKQKHIPGCVY